MAMVVAHNIPALQTYNVVNSTSSALQKSINKLSTGLRINSAADDAAGLAISEKMRAQVRGLDQAVANSQDGISMIQTAEGALSETHSILQRMRELSVQAANDTLTQQDRGYIQEEVDQLREEITRIGNTTQFNKKKLLNGDAAVLWSSSDSGTKAIVNGGLRQIDQFGQKKSVEGNYNIKIKADPGQGEVQKSDIFKIKHPNVVMDKSTNTTYGVDDVSVNDVPAGTYSIDTVASGDLTTTAPIVTGSYNVAGAVSDTVLDLEAAALANDGSSAGDYTVTVGGTTIASVKLTWDSTNNNYTVSGGTNVTQSDTNATVAANMLGANNVISMLNDDIQAYIDRGAPTTSGYTLSKTLTAGDASTGSTLNVKAVRTDGSEVGVLNGAMTTGTVTQTDSTTTVTAVTPDQIVKGTVTQANLAGNGSVLFEVKNVDAKAGTVELSAVSTVLKEDGTTTTGSQDSIVLTGASGGGTAVALDTSLGLGTGAIELQLDSDFIDALQEGSKFVYNFTKDPTTTANAVYVQVSGKQNSDWPDNWTSVNAGVTDGKASYGLDATKAAGKDIKVSNYYLNEKTGESTLGTITLETGSKFKDLAGDAGGTNLASFEAAYIGQVAKGDVALRDLDKFWDTEGNFMLTDPQTITLTQGDGKSASVTLYANDTLKDVAEKLNNAIASGLGQAQYADNASNFVTFTEDTTANTSESVAGTFLIRSIIPGSNGTISFSGDESVINAFSLNTIQDAKETNYTATVTDAHSGVTIAKDVQVTGNKLIGVVNENVDVEFDNMIGISAKWDDARKAYTYTATSDTTTLHLSDNTTVFQIGANEGEDMGVNIGDMRSHALGLDAVNVTNRESAARSITVIDGAIDKVSMQRSKLGAYQNRLEHTINNLNTASENLTSAESRIRDTDMAKEMMNFSKLQIMLQAGNSMLAQANQLPQNVLSLVR